MKRLSLRAATVVAIALALAPAARAGYIIDPTGGTTLWSAPPDHDDDYTTRSLGFTFNLYGQNLTQIGVTVNGNLSSPTNNSWVNSSLPSNDGVRRVDALWDDLYLFTGENGSVIERKSSAYYAVTWDNVQRYSDPTSIRYSFQAVLFGSDTTINGFAFQTGDIAMGYNPINAYSASYLTATVGLNEGDGVGFTPTPGTTDGAVSGSNVNVLPTGTNQFVLYRPDGAGGYTASVQEFGVSPVPAPPGFILAGLGCLGMVGGLRLRRRFAPAM
jgi:hypothetical protein